MDDEIQKILSKGINFEHIFNPYQGNRDPRLPFAEEDRKKIENNLREEEFKQVADLGFRHVRVSLGRAFLQEPQKPFNLRPEGLALLDKAVGLAMNNGLGIVFDMHQLPPPKIFYETEALDAFRKMWGDLAAHFSGKSPGVIFELLNEPVVDVLTYTDPPAEKDLARWRDIVKDLVNTVHQKDPNRYIVVTGAGWGEEKGTRQMGSLGLPRLLYSFHYYEPMVFTHQAATWSYKALAMVKDLPYPVPASDVKKCWDLAKEQGRNDKPFREAEKGFGKDAMRETLQPILD